MESTIHVFLSYLRVERGLAQNTILAYGRDLKRFAEFLRKRHKQRLEDVTREDVVDFLSNLYKEKLDSRSVARYLVSLRGIYKFATMEGMVNADPTENLESPKIRNSLPTYLRVEEINKLLEAPDLATPIGLRDRAMLEVFYSTGLRVSELLNLRISDIDMRIGCVR
jgi:integrase/recombinase XerD